MSDIIVVESKPQVQPEKLKPQYEYLKGAIRTWFRSLLIELGHYEQTTHGCLCPEPSLLDVVTSIQKVYEHPSAYNISELDQRILNWLKHEEPKVT